MYMSIISLCFKCLMRIHIFKSLDLPSYLLMELNKERDRNQAS